jgi:hypothetical protein
VLDDQVCRNPRLNQIDVVFRTRWSMAIRMATMLYRGVGFAEALVRKTGSKVSNWSMTNYYDK